MSGDIERIRAALQFIDSSDRDIWLKMAFAIKDELGDAGFDLWDAWSQQADTYQPASARDVWKSAKATGPVKIGTLFHAAKENGWSDDGAYQQPTPEALAERRRVATERAAIEEVKQDRERVGTAMKAAAIYKAGIAVVDNPYLLRKGVSPTAALREIEAGAALAILGYAPKYGDVLLAGRLLVVPVQQGEKLSTLELIDGEGRKAALVGRGSKAGSYWPTECLPDGDGAGLTLQIGEGVATALSAKQSSGHLAIAALSASNMAAVAKAMRKRYPAALIVLLADLNKKTGAPDRLAVAAALAVDGVVAVPDFGADRADGAKDFNDLMILRGPETVKGCIDAAIASQAPAAGAENPDAMALVDMTTDAVKTKKQKGIASDSITCTYGGGSFDISRQGVFFIGTDKDGNEQPPKWICSPLAVLAKTRDAKSGEWGRLLQWRDDDQVLHQWAMPLELLQSDGTDMRRELARMGLTIAPTKAARDLLASFVQVWPVEHRARCVDRLGWHGAVYVTPSESIGQDDEIVVFQNAHAIEPAFSAAGTLIEWRASVAALAAGNSRLVFALSVAFAGALADVAGEDSGGFHLRGGSSSGKTTALKVAASVWGNPNAYPRLWRATANGLEGLAALHNDGLLILDELSQIDPKEAGEAAYLLANGQGKARASRTGAARQSARWRLMFLSAGEESLTALMASVGKKANAGQEIRLADIDADAGAGMGVFELLHDQPSPAALALAVKDAAIKFHGAAGVAWLRCIVDDRAKLSDLIENGIKQFVEKVAPKDANGQVLRVARRFGLAAVAGELATHYEITGWLEGESTRAAHKCFAAWLESFGGTVNREERNILSQVRAFFEAHGASRFEDMAATNDQRIINRAGFYRAGTSGEREFLVLPEAFKREICQGFDTKTATLALLAAGWVKPGNDRRDTQKPRIRGLGPTRCYVFTARMWECE